MLSHIAEQACTSLQRAATQGATDVCTSALHHWSFATPRCDPNGNEECSKNDKTEINPETDVGQAVLHNLNLSSRSAEVSLEFEQSIGRTIHSGQGLTPENSMRTASLAPSLQRQKLFYVQAVDQPLTLIRPAVEEELYEELLKILSIQATKRLPAVVLWHQGMRMRFTTTLQQPFAVQDVECTVVGFDPDDTLFCTSNDRSRHFLLEPTM